MSLSNPVSNLVDPWLKVHQQTWCEAPKNASWRWVGNGAVNGARLFQKDPSQKIHAVTTNDMLFFEKANASLAAVFKTMRTEINGLDPAVLPRPDSIKSLTKLREVVSDRYAKFCNTYCIFARIWELFLSIFPGRLSTMMEHKRLIHSIDFSLGAVDQAGTPLFDKNVVAMIDPVKRELKNWKDDVILSPSVSALRLMASVVFKQNGIVLYRLHDTSNAGNASDSRVFDKTYNKASDKPKLFFDEIGQCVDRLPKDVTGFPSNGDIDVEFELLVIKKSHQSTGQDADFLIHNGKLNINQPNSASVTVRRNFSVMTVKTKSYVQALMQSQFKHLKMPANIFDSNSNLI